MTCRRPRSGRAEHARANWCHVAITCFYLPSTQGASEVTSQSSSCLLYELAPNSASFGGKTLTSIREWGILQRAFEDLAGRLPVCPHVLVIWPGHVPLPQPHSGSGPTELPTHTDPFFSRPYDVCRNEIAGRDLLSEQVPFEWWSVQSPVAEEFSVEHWRSFHHLVAEAAFALRRRDARRARTIYSPLAGKNKTRKRQR